MRGHDEQDSINCPTYEGCLGRCLKAAFGIPDLISFAITQGLKASGEKFLETVGTTASLASTVTSRALLLFCEIHCSIDVRAY